MRSGHVGRSSAICFDGAIGYLMESIRQGANDSSKSFQANGILQTPLQYNTARKKIGEVIGRVRKSCDFHAGGRGPSRIETEGLPAQDSAGDSAQGGSEVYVFKDYPRVTA